MPSDRWRFCVLLLLSLAGYGAAQVLGNASTKASLRVGDYADELSNGTALPLYTLIWRAVGSSFFSSDGVNQTFATDANNAFLAANHTMTYTVANIRNTAVINTTRKANGTAGEQGAQLAESLMHISQALWRQKDLVTLLVQWRNGRQIPITWDTAALTCS